MAYPSIGNSLTSISSMTTLPPSLHLRPLQSDNGPRHFPPPPPFTNLPTATAQSRKEDPSPLHESRVDQSRADLGVRLGSVPSPRPRFAHLISSAPARPRIPRVLSSSSSVVRMPSPLNPTSQESSSRGKKIGQTADEGGVDIVGFGSSVPQPRPRIFASTLGSAPDKSEILAKKEGVATVSATRSDVGAIISKSEAANGKVLRSKCEAQRANPVRITVERSPPPEVDDESWRLRAPSSFSTIVQLMYRPK